MALRVLLATVCGVAFTLAHSVSSEKSFAYGADVGFVTQQERSGYSFYDSNGKKADPFVLLKNFGVNAIRLRVWVDPLYGDNGAADVLAKAKRAAALGQRILISFHYSDTWTNPGLQDKPAAWANHTLDQLIDDVYSHTQNTLKFLKDNGIDVEWVQVGNEISTGMLWPEGYVPGNFTNLARMISIGYDGVKAVFPNAKVIVHLANGYNNEVFRWFFDDLTKAGPKFDVVGMSYYPPAEEWQHYNDLALNNIKDMISRYGKQVMVVEVGMHWSQGETAKAFIADLLVKVKELKDNVLGVFYWEPQCSPGWNFYNMGALTPDWKFNAALEAFREAV